jgi:hypothetical protein
MTGKRLVATLGAVAIAMAATACTPLGEERVLFFPTAAHLDEQGENWVVPVEGWVYVPKRGAPLRRWGWWWLTRPLGLEDKEYEQAREIFDERADAFLVDGKSGRVIFVHVGEESHMSPPTDSAGRFGFSINLPVAQAQSLAAASRLAFHARRSTPHGTYYFQGRSHLVDPTGVSVLSDIDDTIKIS